MQHSLLRDGGQLLYDAFGALLFWLITIKCNHFYQMQLEFNIKFKMQHSLLREAEDSCGGKMFCLPKILSLAAEQSNYCSM